MAEDFLYLKIAESIRMQILHGEMKPGDKLGSMREMAVKYNCTVGTIQHAYQALARQGLIRSRPGQGTRVAESLQNRNESSLHKAHLIHRAEAFLLEVLTAGYTPAEAEAAVRTALDRWRVVETESQAQSVMTIRFGGSHDLAVTWLAGHFAEIVSGHSLDIGFTGSMGGLTALAENKIDLAGCHLWHEQSNTYNVPFVRQIMPGRRIARVTLAYRQLGLIVPAGNPNGARVLVDLTMPTSRFINRQAGSGTRVWLDAQLRHLGIDGDSIAGYQDKRSTHSEVARAVAEGEATIGLGLEAAAHAFGLDFIQLTRERYDLVMHESFFLTFAMQRLIEWLNGEGRGAISNLIGYDTIETGLWEIIS